MSKHYTQAFYSANIHEIMFGIEVQNHMVLLSLATAYCKINRFQSVCFMRTISNSINVLYFIRTIARVQMGIWTTFAGQNRKLNKYFMLEFFSFLHLISFKPGKSDDKRASDSNFSCTEKTQTDLPEHN